MQKIFLPGLLYKQHLLKKVVNFIQPSEINTPIFKPSEITNPIFKPSEIEDHCHFILKMSSLDFFENELNGNERTLDVIG